MLTKKAFAQMRNDLETYDKAREQLIKDSRDVLKSSKAAIYSMHRNDAKTAEQQLKRARATISALHNVIATDAHLAQVGAYIDAVEEFVEASCYASYLKDGTLPSPEELGVHTEVYLPGLCDLMGELVRKAINSAIADDPKTALRIRDFVKDTYEELMLFDFPNSPVRRKFDSIKYGLEKLEDLALQLKLKR
ncbi:hypothetical protein HY493_01985 [Candidatus Woesearchaeota archaeon]|nr:hypothetical protein [Candidatus Woesearchaeota archaeon]